MPPVRTRRRLAAFASLSGLSIVVACSSTRFPASAALAPRFVAIHNTLAALGLAQVGPLREGSLAQGEETRLPLDLPAGCTTVVAVGGDGVRDLDVSLVDPKGAPVAHDTTREPQAVLRACVEAADSYVLVVKAASGAGPWVVATWAGGVGSGEAASSAQGAASAAEPDGTCESPIPLHAGTVTGSTRHGQSANAGSCDHSDAREIVYELDVAHRQKVTLDVEAKYDSVLYLRKDECADEDAEVDCNDDAPNGGRNRSRIERILDPGKYFVFVDGYNQEAGAYKLTVTTQDVVALSDACRDARLLAVGAPVSGTTDGLADNVQASCGGGAPGADVPWRFDLSSRARVRLVEHSDAVAAVVHVRRACSDEQSETACGESRAPGGDAALTGVFDPGGYTVFADARDRDAAGPYTLSLETEPPEGTGVLGDGCGDAAPLTGSGGTVPGDTFAARDDVSSACGGAGAADVVYRVDVPARSRFRASLQSEEAPHVLAMWHGCGDRASEIACGRAIDEVLAPGTYFVSVDGALGGGLGRFALAWAMQDLGPQAAACASAPALVAGRPVIGTTAGGADHFWPSCAGPGEAASGPDRVYRFTIASRATVHLELEAGTFDALLVLRRSCADGPGAGMGVEVECSEQLARTHRARLDATLDPGTYYAVVDAASPNDQGAFVLNYSVTSAK